MPEGDSVFRLAERLRPLEGRLIESCELRVPQLATRELAGRRITRVWPWGKHLFWQVGDDILHTHLRMDGTWRIHPSGARWSSPAHTARIVVRVSGGVELVGHDLGIVELWPADQYDNHTAHLGPDPLASDWERPGRWRPSGRAEALRRLRTHPKRTIGEALLDQRVLAGVGNEYRAEVCFLLGIHPAVPVAEADAMSTLDKVASLMRANLGSAVRTFTGDRRRGETTFVFGRKHRPCRRCGTRIEGGWLGGATSSADSEADRQRVVWWCPTCQGRWPQASTT